MAYMMDDEDPYDRTINPDDPIVEDPNAPHDSGPGGTYDNNPAVGTPTYDNRDRAYDVDNIVSPGNYPSEMNYPGLNPDEVKQREQQVGGYLNDQFKASIGRDLDSSEYAQAEAIYRNHGGDYYRNWIKEKAGNGPQNNVTGGMGGATGDRSIAGGKTHFEYPDWTPPDTQFDPWNAPKRDITPFQYEDFKGPTAENFQADPGYQFRADQMDRTIKNAKSAQGLLATGNTLADLMNYRGGLASQEYGNVYNRQFGAWDANRNKALDTWKSGHDLSNEDYQHSLTDYLTNYQRKTDDWNRDLTKYQTNLGKEEAGYGLNLDTSQLNYQRDNNQFGNMLNLYQIMTRNMPTYQPSV